MPAPYPDVPGPRLAYDVGVTVVYGSSGAALSGADLDALNDESNSGIGPSTDTITFLTPTVNDWLNLVGIYLCTDGGGALENIELSSDTTDGTDGTWVSVATIDTNAGANVVDTYRTGITVIPFGGISGFGRTGIRVSYGTGGAVTLRALHLYGSYAETIFGADTIRLGALDDGLEPTSIVDFDSSPQDSTDGNAVTVTNSSALTAHGVTVGVDTPLTDAVVPLEWQIYLSADGGVSWHGELALGDMAPDAVQTILVHRFTPHDADLGPWAVRIFATAVSYS